MEFFDRIEERVRLERFLSSGDGSMACLYGRRRIGKSRLLDEVLGVVFGAIWRKIKRGANKVLGRDENSGKEVEEEVKAI